MQPPHSKRIAITGIGVLSPNGVGAHAYADALLAGKSGVRRLTSIDTTGLKSWAAGSVPDFQPDAVMEPSEARRVPRMVPMALLASREALGNARIQLHPGNLELARKIAVVLGTGGGGMEFVEQQYREYFKRGKGSLFSITAGTHGNLSSELSIALGLRGASHVLSTGCTSSTDAIGHAMMMIRIGATPMALAGGADAPISPCILLGFERMRVISTRRWNDPAQASRPFDRDRDGFVLGEGAWMFVLEDLDHARSRSAPILAELTGYASTCDAYHRVQIAPDLSEPARAIELALQDAGTSANAIDYINLHGTGTELNDRMETLAIRKVFGDAARTIPCSSTKSMIGHPQGACGAAALAATVLCMNRGAIHPTINLDHPDSNCNLDYVPHVARRAEVNTALCNCIAFGSKNSALIVRRLTD